MSGAKILFVGESWVKHTTHIKGFDQFTSVEYEEGAAVFLSCLERGGFTTEYVRAHEVSRRFPTTAAGLAEYDAIVLSDIGSNSFLLADETFLRSEIGVNRLQLVSDFVAAGGGLVKVGGYMSFTGIDARARYGMSPLAVALPVEMLPYDDRIEAPQGIAPETDDAGPSGHRQDAGRLAGSARLQQDHRQAGQHDDRDRRRRPAAGRGQPRKWQDGRLYIGSGAALGAPRISSLGRLPGPVDRVAGLGLRQSGTFASGVASVQTVAREAGTGRGVVAVSPPRPGDATRGGRA